MIAAGLARASRPHVRRCPGRGWTLTVGLVAMCAAGAAGAAAQVDDGSASRAVAGGALGFYSGGMLGVVGGLFPCDRTLHGRVCVAASGGAGALIGLVSGAAIGHEDRSRLADRARGAGYGALVGTAAGFVLQQAVRQYAWNDALLVGAFGAAIGAAPRGTLVGTGVGVVVGSLAWAFSPQGGVQDVILFTVVGAALGGLLDWGEGALDADRSRAPTLTSTFSIPWG